MILVMDPGILVRNQNYVLVLDFLDSNQKSEFETLNGTIRVQCGTKSEQLNIRRVTPYFD